MQTTYLPESMCHADEFRLRASIPMGAVLSQGDQGRDEVHHAHTREAWHLDFWRARNGATTVVDFVALKAQAIHKDQQSQYRDSAILHSKALKSREFQ